MSDEWLRPKIHSQFCWYFSFTVFKKNRNIYRDNYVKVNITILATIITSPYSQFLFPFLKKEFIVIKRLLPCLRKILLVLSVLLNMSPRIGQEFKVPSRGISHEHGNLVKLLYLHESTEHIIHCVCIRAHDWITASSPGLDTLPQTPVAPCN